MCTKLTCFGLFAFLTALCRIAGNLYAYFNVVDECSGSGTSVWVIAVGASIGALFLIALLFVIIIFSNRDLRTKVLPFKVRRENASEKY